MNTQYTEKFQHLEFDAVFLEKIASICNSITASGLDPYSQLTGYLLTGKDYYITRTGNARAMIVTLDNAQIQAYVKKYLEKS